ncbi:MAG: hypothetical protein AVDCRST_MAG23-2645 [uncultured Sphingosinicella sp.]|uniref:Uncharacterized protein n=1 Tax=uncultured Sphingosinicella sp. TaxID=478748 RepID=A0A6J4UCM2_9SPHN|nr:hypothetical protein [uncultured Sphingosinicella sp.]CAA9547148.1 MAG: hypothetical protein AVDCRST_MAG23-2645 [uncultured Sphingosinicella sp.]
MRHEQVQSRRGFDLVDVAQIWPAGAGGSPPLGEVEAAIDRRATPAVPDMPAAVGRFIVGIYGALIGAFILTMARSAEASFMIAVSALYLAVFLAVPAIFLKIESDPSNRPSLGRFMRTGVDTFTGHVSAGSALVQIFVVPVLLTFAILAMGITGLLVIQ